MPIEPDKVGSVPLAKIKRPKIDYLIGRPKGSKDKSIEAHNNRSKSHLGNKGQNWKGGKTRKKDGYIMIWCPTHPNNKNGYVAEHRLIMERHIGRTLLPTEIVHHINQNHSDNRVKNLMLFENNGKHRNYHKHHLKKEDLK